MRTPNNQLPSVARQLGISTASAKGYKAIIEEGGIDALENMGVGGRKSALNAHALKWIANSFRGSPAAFPFGFETDQWTDACLQPSLSGVFSTLLKKHEERRSPRTAYRRNAAWLMSVSRTLASP